MKRGKCVSREAEVSSYGDTEGMTRYFWDVLGGEDAVGVCETGAGELTKSQRKRMPLRAFVVLWRWPLSFRGTRAVLLRLENFQPYVFPDFNFGDLLEHLFEGTSGEPSNPNVNGPSAPSPPSHSRAQEAQRSSERHTAAPACARRSPSKHER